MAVCARKGRGGNGTPWTTFLLDLNLKASELPSITCAICGSLVPIILLLFLIKVLDMLFTVQLLRSAEKGKSRTDDVDSQPQRWIWTRFGAVMVLVIQELPASVINQGHSQGDLSGSWTLGTARLSLLICLTFNNSAPPAACRTE